MRQKKNECLKVKCKDDFSCPSQSQKKEGGGMKEQGKDTWKRKVMGKMEDTLFLTKVFFLTSYKNV